VKFTATLSGNQKRNLLHGRRCLRAPLNPKGAKQVRRLCSGRPLLNGEKRLGPNSPRKLRTGSATTGDRRNMEKIRVTAFKKPGKLPFGAWAWVYRARSRKTNGRTRKGRGLLTWGGESCLRDTGEQEKPYPGARRGAKASPAARRNA